MRCSFKQTLYGFSMLASMLLIFYFSSQPAVNSQNLSDGLLERLLQFLGLRVLAKSHWLYIGIRKLAHIIEFFILGLTASLFFRQRERENGQKALSWRYVTIILCGIYACSDELHQYFVPGRSMQASDMLLDLMASSVAAIGIYALEIAMKDREEKDEQTSPTKTE